MKAFRRSPLGIVALLLSGLAVVAPVSGCHSSPGADVAATVNGKPILRSDLEKFYKASQQGDQQNPTPEQANIVRLNILRQMIEDEILWQRATKLHLAASDEDVNAKLTEMKAPFTQEEFDKQLKARNITLDDLRRDIRRNLTKTKLLNEEIDSKINITDAEITNYYNQHKSDFDLIEPNFHLAQIIVTTTPAQQTGNLQDNKASGAADALKKINALHNRLESGEDFGQVAMNFSEDPNTASNGGDMGFIPESQLRTDAPVVYSAVSKLKPNEITGVIPVYDNGPSHRVIGYAIYKLLGWEPAGQRQLNDPRVQQAIHSQLYNNRMQLLEDAYLEVLHDNAKVHNYFAEQILKEGAQ